MSTPTYKGDPASKARSRADRALGDQGTAALRALYGTKARADDVLAEVGDDRRLAALALRMENARDTPRTSLLKRLNAIAD